MTYASLIQPVLWALFGGTALVLAGKTAVLWKRKKTVNKALLYAAGAALAVSFIVIPSIAVVPGGYRGVVYRWDGGIDPSERGEGVSLIVPWFQHLTTTSVRTQKVFSSKVFAQSADLQEITVVASVNFHVDPTKAAELYQKVGPQYASTVIQPALFQRTKAAVGQVYAEDFAKQRDSLAKTIEKQLETQLVGYGIIVEFVNIEDAIFDKAFVTAVKNKIIAQQKAQEQKNLVEARKYIKEQTIINAEATAQSVIIKANKQAEANRKIAASVTPDLLRWQYLSTWDGTLPTTLVGSGQNPSLFLNVGP